MYLLDPYIFKKEKNIVFRDHSQIMSAKFGGVWTPPLPLIIDCQHLAKPSTPLCQQLEGAAR